MTLEERVAMLEARLHANATNQLELLMLVERVLSQVEQLMTLVEESAATRQHRTLRLIQKETLQ
jgi:hypothetical protein